MSNSGNYMKSTGKLFEGIAKLAKTQTQAQDELIKIINDMCDSLESATAYSGLNLPPIPVQTCH